MIEIGRHLLGGNVIIIGVNDDLVTTIIVVPWQSQSGRPFTITYDPGVTIDFIEQTLDRIDW